MSASTTPATVSVAILGTDAALAARPATAIQLAHAVLAVGYDAVYPASWGDEIVAAGCLQRAAERDGQPVVLCSCPLVVDRLLRSGHDLERFLMPMVSPPVAVARYLRAVYAGRALHITYVGGCPDAACAEIDARLSPAELEAELRARGIIATRQPQYFESVLPPDRRRFYSLPGGAPSPNWLRATPRPRSLVTLAGEDLAAELAQAMLSGDASLIDAAPLLGCVCSGATADVRPTAAREEAERIDPPRASSPVIDSSLPIELDRELPERGEYEFNASAGGEDAGQERAPVTGAAEARDRARTGSRAPSEVVWQTPPTNGGGQRAGGAAPHSPERRVGGEGHEADDDNGDVIHSYSRSAHDASASGHETAVHPSLFAAESSTEPKPRPHITLAQAADAFNIELALGLLDGVPLLPDELESAKAASSTDIEPPAESAEAALPADIVPPAESREAASADIEPPAESPEAALPAEILADAAPATPDTSGVESRNEAPPQDAATIDMDDDVDPPPRRGSARRITPTSVRRIATSTPIVRTGSGRAVPRAYAAHRRPATASWGDAPPTEREADIQLAFEPLAPPADYRPPIEERITSPADLGLQSEQAPSPAAAERDVRSYARPLFLESQRSRNWSRGVIVIAAIVGLGVVSVLAARYLALRDERQRLDAVAEWETPGVIDVDPGVAPPVDRPEATAAEVEEESRDEPAAVVPRSVDPDTDAPPAPPPVRATRPARPAPVAAPPVTAARPDRADELRLRQFDSIIRALDSQRVATDPD